MSWKKAVFFGGAVLVSAACADVTTPTAPAELTKIDRASVSATNKTTTLATPTLPQAPVNAPLSCGVAVIHVGLDGELIITCPPVTW